MTNEEKISYFAFELSEIKDENLKKFLTIILEGTGDWFYHDPASTSGKYHPKYALGDGGLMRHTRAVAYWAKELCRTELFDVNERQGELLYVAAILHDIRKHTATGGYIQKHARAAYDLILATQAEHPELLSKEEAQYMADAVSTHMGIWGVKDGERKPTSDAEKLLHIADYNASRKEIIMEFASAPIQFPKIPSADILGIPNPTITVVTEATAEKKEDTQEEKSIVFNFGKYRGKTIDEVYAENADYLKWIAEQKEFFNPEIQNQVKEYLKNK